jgi:hypothetical protein
MQTIETLFASRLRDIVSRSSSETSVDKFWYYNRVSRCQTISSVECIRILHKLVTIHGTNGQWHIIVRI